MAQFKFRLLTLLRIREMDRDEKRGKLAEAYHAEALLQQQQQEVKKEIHQLQEFQRHSITSSTIDVNQLMEVQRHQLVLNTQQETMQKQAELLAGEIERRRQTLVDSDREVRVLEKLQIRQKQQFQREQQYKESKEFDELGQLARKNPLAN